jgi:[glutamine synthetase] adenylyltransferase / [glutamine synthetase]-adenylyl-L-tyrosine phosphorylase
VHVFDERVESLFGDLPDRQGAHLFLERLQKDSPSAFKNLSSEPGLLSDTLTVAAWSPLLAATLEQNPDYISWLSRERTNPRVRTRDELKESLARFAMTNSSVSAQVLLARFRRRELLRTYLHDIRRTHTLVETTEELSNLADAILDYALSLAHQDLDNRYGAPQRTDDRGRSATAEFCIVALGKLGSYELNYASDIDLVFIYSDDGTTASAGERGEVTNREYFIKLTETIVKLVGQPSGEGAAYRVDLRLRPHGRDGALSCSLNEVTRYYRESAQAWELQTLIRARAAGGSAPLFSRFVKSIQERVFRKDVSVKDALASVRLAKQKIDKHIERNSGGFNVKLNRGGIREIEFIAQALQLAHGGKDEWLRVAHTLISLGRLGERNLITEQERTELSDAYMFLRTLEHRLQMEHGLQTHTVPLAPEQKALVARRMKFSGPTATEQLDRALQFHTSNVSRAFERVFGRAGIDPRAESEPSEKATTTVEAASCRAPDQPVHLEAAAANAAAAVFAQHLSDGSKRLEAESVALLLQKEALGSLNPHRALTLAARVASSLDKSDLRLSISPGSLAALVRLFSSSEFFGEMVANNPALITSMVTESAKPARRDFRSLLRASITTENDFSAELSALRRTWAGLLLDIGIRDASGEISIFESNRLQTELASASINIAYLVARRELARRYGRLENEPRIAILALGRLASGGVDYGSDLDIIIVYDSFLPSPVSALSQEEAYARLGELMIAALGSVTREGHLYRVDLRLRPDGKNGPLVASSQSFLDYLKERTVVWEWLAYVKLRAVGGDLDLGKMIETHARHAIHEAARQSDPEELKRETRHVRDRLEKEKGRQDRHRVVDVKFGAGGMLDVYFATRYLQLRDDVSDEGEDRSTASTLERLRNTDSLNEEDFAALSSGYALLRSIDHHLRLIVGRQALLPAADHPALRDIARQLGFVSAVHLHDTLVEKMRSMRQAYDRITT